MQINTNKLRDDILRCLSLIVVAHMRLLHESYVKRLQAKSSSGILILRGVFHKHGTTTHVVIVNVNWDTAYPPATHWSGTIVDYSYGLNNHHYVSIGPDNWSDHRLTVVDWTW